MNNINPGAIGSNISNAFRNERDNSTLDKILMEAIDSKDPNALDHAMRQIVGNVAPQNQKTALQILQKKQENIIGNRLNQQLRLQMDSILKRYNSRIKELTEEINKVRYDQRAPLIEKKKALQKERDDLLGFEALNPVEEESKPVFDPSNATHKSRRDAVLKEAKGDRKKAQEILEKEFSL